jgi:hypothetical protein
VTKVGPVNNDRPKETIEIEEEMDIVDPYDFDMDPVQQSSGENNMSDSSNHFS